MEPRPIPLALAPSKPVGSCYRREFLKLSVAAGLLPLLGTFAWSSIVSDERTAWYRDAKFGMFIQLGTLLAGERGSLVADHGSETGWHCTS